MQLRPGARLGPYELVSSLGAGGMGEVYEARDTRLDRRVALKIVRPSSATADDEWRVRFEREARAIAALNHPNICTLYDTARDGDVEFLVMERLEGETLAERLSRGRMPVEEAIAVAAQIADALDCAHQRGIVHRDLKPANVMLVPARGAAMPVAKLLDFGVARLRAPSAAVDAATRAVTITGGGSLVGTLQYMAPEQIEGRDVDARADLFAFGGVVYEMFAGRPAFQAPNEARLISALLESHPPPLAQLRPDAPPAVALLVHACLEKDPAERWASAHDARVVLLGLPHGTAPQAAQPDRLARFVASFRRRPLVWSLLPLAALVAIAALVVAALRLRPEAPRPLDILSILPPAGTTLTVGDSPQVSPDGRAVAFVATDEAGRTSLYVRNRGLNDAQPLAGTDEATLPFWSPDSRQLGFFARGSLKTIPAGGGPVQTLAPVTVPRGGTWNRQGEIVFVPFPNSLPQVVRVNGGTATQVPMSNADRERRWFPYFLPDGRHYLYLSIELERRTAAAVRVASLDSADVTDVVRATSAAIYVDPGFLLYRRDGALVAQPFEASSFRVTGPPTVVAPQVGFNAIGYQGLYSASSAGVIAYLPPYAGWRMSWFDRSGRRVGTAGPPGQYNSVCIAGDGRQIVYDQADPRTGNMDIWSLDVAGNTASRLTFDPSVDFYPVCAKSGDEIVFSSLRASLPSLFRMRTSAPGTERLVRPTSVAQIPTDWSADGAWVLYSTQNPKTKWDVWAMPMGEGEPVPVATTAAEERNARFSPDGRLVAYMSQDEGSSEIMVQPFPPTGARWQASSGGGRQPFWAPDGRTLYYLAPDNKLVGVANKGGPGTFAPGAVTTVLEARVAGLEPGNQGGSVQMAPDGQRFLVVEGGTEPSPITLLLNWTGTR